jgi:mRNA-degrading endonuclease RelE of RelBE toxin-antitoxin system
MTYIEPAQAWMTVAETPSFIRQAAKLWTEDDRNAFVNFIAANPDAGDIIPHTSGLRKIRGGRPGTGKRGGVRVIYFYHDDSMPLYLLLIYAKAAQENWSSDEKQRAKALTDTLRQTYQRH